MHALINDPLPKKSYRHQLGPMIHLSTTQKFDPLLLINLENIKVGQISFLNVATFKSAQVPWTYILAVSFTSFLGIKTLWSISKKIWPEWLPWVGSWGKRNWELPTHQKYIIVRFSYMSCKNGQLLWDIMFKTEIFGSNMLLYRFTLGGMWVMVKYRWGMFYQTGIRSTSR